MELQKAQAQAKKAMEAKKNMEDNAKLLDMQDNLGRGRRKAKELAAELQQARNELEELQTEVQILKAKKEVQNLEETNQVIGSDASKALERDNQRLPETLVHMRDLVAQDCVNLTQLERSLEEDKALNIELSMAKTKLKDKAVDP